jgi:uncharacterized Ntn-hydrolase superfamily protein
VSGRALLGTALLLAGLLGPAPATAASSPASSPGARRGPLAHTYSIVARDAKTGEIGVAVQSHWFSVGSMVTWAEAGVGAVATQSFVEPAYGPRGLDLMRRGTSAPEALRQLIAADEQREVRQVAMVDAAGNAAAHTGTLCIPAAGHHVGEGYSVQANLMLDEGVWPAMARAFELGQGDLADRLVAALAAAEEAGGDIRGRQSAAILVVRGQSTGEPWRDRVFDLRVEDHPDPVVELRRLVALTRAYLLMNEGDEHVAAGRDAEALAAYSAAERRFPENDEFVFWHGTALATLGRWEEALPIYRRAFLMNPAWMLLVPRLAKVGLLPDDKDRIRSILEVGPSAGAPPAPAPSPAHQEKETRSPPPPHP